MDFPAAARALRLFLRRRPAGTAAAAFALLPALAAAAESDYLTVALGPDQTIRQVAEEYLADADLWPEILKASGLISVTELAPGASLRIPVNEISTANQALVRSLDQIQNANHAGAQIFAPEEIGQALDLREEALLRRLERQWRSTRELANQSFDMATLALEKSEQQRDRAAEALVTDRTGRVEGQRPEDIDWRNLMRLAILTEEEKVRTLSDSTAQITFRDASRLRLNENSNAVIQRMRYDPLSREEVAKVSLVEGDFYAILSSDKDRKRFDVEIPEVNASISSGDFWVSHDESGAKFANYDDRLVRIESRGQAVNLGRNQGTVIEAGAGPAEVRQVLPPPQVVAPADGDIVYGTEPALAWSPVEGAAGYWLEIAADQSFDRLVLSRFGLEAPGFSAERLEPGEYFWRASALDGFGLPGERTAASSFTVRIDETPPFLRIDTPLPDTIIREASVRVTGEAEPGARLSVNGAPVEIDADGGFEATVPAVEGDNTNLVSASDAAGNEISRTRGFVHMPDRQSVVAFDPALRRDAEGRFLSGDRTVSLRGTTTPNATIDIAAGGMPRASAASDAAGRFTVNVPLDADTERLELKVTAPSGFGTTEAIEAAVDRVAPEIAIEELPPRLTGEPDLLLRGRTEADATLSLNGRPLALADGQFEAAVALVEGDNAIEIVASDPFGNVKVDRWSVRLDREAPRLTGSTLTQAAGAGGTALVVDIAAADASGLAKAAPILVSAGDERYKAYLRYNRATKSYQGSIAVPDGFPFALASAEVLLEDDAGNTRSYRLTFAGEDGGQSPEEIGAEEIGVDEPTAGIPDSTGPDSGEPDSSGEQ